MTPDRNDIQNSRVKGDIRESLKAGAILTVYQQVDHRTTAPLTREAIALQVFFFTESRSKQGATLS